MHLLTEDPRLRPPIRSRARLWGQVGLNIRNRIPWLGQKSIFFEAGENGVLLDTDTYYLRHRGINYADLAYEKTALPISRGERG